MLARSDWILLIVETVWMASWYFPMYLGGYILGEYVCYVWEHLLPIIFAVGFTKHDLL